MLLLVFRISYYITHVVLLCCALNVISPSWPSGRTIETEVSVSPEQQVVLQDGEQGRHLGEQQHLVMQMLQFGQDPVQQFKLARHTVQVRPTQEQNEKHDTMQPQGLFMFYSRGLS